MAVYLDTSVLVPMFFREVGSVAMLERVSQESELWVSRWTTAKFCSAAAFKIRRGDCDLAAANRSVLPLVLSRQGGDNGR